MHFLISPNLPFTNIALLDSDTNVKAHSQKNVIITSVRKYENAKGIRVGIENALVLDNIDLDQFRIEKKTIDDYGGAKVITEFQKMK